MKRNLSGQVGLLLLVVLGLVISVVLSIAAKSLSDVVLSRQDKENSTAFSLAESGVEEALKAINNQNLPSGSVGISDTTELISGSYSVTEVDGFDLYVKAGEQAELDLSGYLGASLTISWTKESDDSENVACQSEGQNLAPSALEIIAIKVDESVEREYYNGYNCNLGNNFLSSLGGVGGYISQVSYTLPASTAKIRVRPYYTGATIKVEGVGLTTQMYLVQSGAAGGDAEKEIEVKRSLDSAGSIFDYALFSGSSIIK